MALANVYVQNYGQIPEFFSKIREGQAPAKFTQQHLRDIGFTSSNYRAYIPLLKTLGFLSSDGVPTSRYRDYRDISQSKRVMGEALKEAYSDLFVISASPNESNKELIEGKFRSAFNVTERPAELMTKTFFALLDLADISSTTDAQPQRLASSEERSKSKQGRMEPITKRDVPMSEPVSLHYNIQIHLPATKDVEVYNAIFRSLKEHLFE